MANIKITELNAAGSLAADDVLPVVDISTDETKKITSTNLFRTLPDGTAAAPALAFSSDQANGIYLAGTDTVGITTGGTQRVTVDASGNVVISGDLTVQGATTTVESTTVTVDDKNIELGSVASPSNTTADGGGITLKGASDKTIKWINSTGCWTFNQPTNFNDHVRIDSSGNVGIGTTHADFKLDVGGAIGLFESNNIVWHDGVGTRAGQLGFTSGEVFTIGRGSSGTESLRIDASGNVQIGTSTSNNYKLHLSTAGSNSVYQQFSNGNTGISGTDGFLVGIAADKSALLYQQEASPVRIFTDSTERLRILSNGNCGIGSTAPGHNLEVKGSFPDFAIVDSDTTNDKFRILHNGGATQLQVDPNNVSSGSHLLLNIDGSERLRVDASGNLFIGGTTAANADIALNADGSASFGSLNTASSITRGVTVSNLGTITTQSSGSENRVLFQGYKGSNLNSTINSDGTATFMGDVAIGTAAPVFGVGTGLEVFRSGVSTVRVSSNNQAVELRSDAGTGTLETRGAFPLKFGTQGSERLRITSDGKLGLGTSAPSVPLTVNSTTDHSDIAIFHAGGGTPDRGLKISTFSNVDANSGVELDAQFSSGAFKFSTGGTERLRIDSSGNVGINNSSPGAKLDVYSSSSRYVRSFPSSGLADFEVLSNNNSQTVFAVKGTGSADLFRAFANTTQAVTIKSSGNVGIGETAAANLLHVKTSDTGITPHASAQIVLERSGTNYLQLLTANTGTQGILFGDSDDNDRGKIVYDHSSDHLRVEVAASEALRIDSSGNVGIGTSSPGLPLDIVSNVSSETVRFRGASGGVGTLRFTSNDAGTNYAFIQSRSTFFDIGSSTSIPLLFSTNGTERMRIDSSGKVGIGISNPGDYHADANSLVTSSGITLANTSQGSIFFADSASGTGEYVGQINYQHSNNSMAFITNNSERMRIDSAGRVGIGTSTFADTATALVIKNSAAGNEHTLLDIVCDTNETARVRFSEDGSNFPAEIKYDTFGQELSFNVNSAERLRIDSSGRLLHNTTSTGTANIIIDSQLGNGSALRLIGKSVNDGSEIDFFADNNSTRLGYLEFNNTVTKLVSETSVPLTLHTNSTERMRITSAGSHYVMGNNADNIRIQQVQGANTSRSFIAAYHSATDGTINTGTLSFNVVTNGNVTNTNNSYGQLSDQKLKENIVDANSQWDNIKDVRVRNFNFIEGQTHTQIGVVAQELEPVSPGLIDNAPDYDDDGNDLGTTTKSVKYSVLYMKAVKALQEAMTRIETLEQRLSDAGIA